MTAGDLEAFLADPANGTDGLSAEVGVVIAVIESAGVKRAKNRAAKLLAEMSVADPEAVVGEWGRVAGLLGSGDNIVRWNAMVAVGNVAAEAGGRRVGGVVADLVGLLGEASMVTAGHAAACLGKIVAAGVGDSGPVVRALVEVDRCRVRGAECNAVLAGKVLGGLVGVLDELGASERGLVVALAERHAESGRKGLARLAGRVIRPS